jgi:hypothetical protein
MDQFSRDVAELMAELLVMMEWDEQPAVIGLGSFFYADSKMTSNFGYFFTSEVELAVMHMPRFTLVDRSRLDDILNELGFQISDLVDKKTAKQIGKIKGLDAMLTGHYSTWDGKVQVKAKLIRVEDTETVVVTKLINSVPADVAVKPPNYEVQKQRINEKIQDWLTESPDVNEQSPSSDFRVTIEPGRIEGYTKGDELKMYVKSEADCYIEIYNISGDGSTRLLFPNEHWLKSHSPNENFIRAGVRTPIPPDPSFKLKISSPYGVETLKLIASTKPFGARARSVYQERGAFPKIGNIDDTQTVETLK